eukprot:GDKI01048212.1.p1 GENE.GDKI01048212.1~~GDKI01048212.1.p1  ORF type:complete len:173 (-),score=29.32 GDKI01048212.1:38-556(-)
MFVGLGAGRAWRAATGVCRVCVHERECVCFLLICLLAVAAMTAYMRAVMCACGQLVCTCSYLFRCNHACMHSSKPILCPLLFLNFPSSIHACVQYQIKVAAMVYQRNPSIHPHIAVPIACHVCVWCLRVFGSECVCMSVFTCMQLVCRLAAVHMHVCMRAALYAWRFFIDQS